MKTLDIQTLCDDGYLQEVNRRFFHPLGLALALTVHDDKTVTMSMLDCRDDPEGYRFEGGDLRQKAQRLIAIASARREARKAALGYWIQPVEEG